MSEYCSNNHAVTKIYFEINNDIAFRLITHIDNYLDLPFFNKLQSHIV